MIFLFMALLILAGALAWMFVPDVKTLRPDIERFLKDELRFQQVELGELSWYWAGHFGIKAASSSFTSHDGSLAVHKSDITVNISVLDFISGKLVPAGVHLSGGNMDMLLDALPGSRNMPMPGSIALKEMQLRWRYGEFSGELERFSMSLDSDSRRAELHVPGSHLQIELSESWLPERLEVNFSDLSWLPDQWKGFLTESVSGVARMDHTSPSAWKVEAALKSVGDRASLKLMNVEWLFDSLSCEFEVGSSENSKESLFISVKSMEYIYGKSQVRATGGWQNGQLKVAASSPHLAMPLIWQALRPLGGKEWHAWLASMKRGVASDARAELQMAWQDPWSTAPGKHELASLQFHVNGHLSDADISLGVYDDLITNTEADIELDQNGLKAIVASTVLPHEVGKVSGGVQIPWQSLEIDVHGDGQVDAGKLHAWIDESKATELKWGTAPAETSFIVRWIPEEEEPRYASIELRPQAAWALQLNEVPLKVESGEIKWVFKEEVRLKKLLWSTPHLNVKTDMTALKDDLKKWHIVDMRSEADGGLGNLASYFLLPIEAAQGKISMTLAFDQKWKGRIDLKKAAWKNFLGMKKSLDEPLSIDYIGVVGTKMGMPSLIIEKIHCNDSLLSLQGSGEVSENGLRLELEKMKTELFDGAIHILAPFGTDPWELDVDAAYLNRDALPLTVARSPDTTRKPWALRAKLKRFVWDNAEIHNASINLASARNSVAVLKAESLNNGELSLHALLAIFSMPGDGVIDLRSFEAGLDSLHLKLSAMLAEEDRGVRWRGFAELSGNFGDMVNRADLSNIFRDGEMRLLFSGQGDLFSDQPWWQGLDGRLRMRVDKGRILKGGTLSKFLAAISIVDLPGLVFGGRDDLTKPGLGYERLQMEAIMHDNHVEVHKLAMRASAMDVAGQGDMNLENSHMDLTLVMRPFQNMDALLSKVPLIRDIFGGAAHSFMRRVYHVYGPVSDAKVDQVSPEEAGLASSGMVELFLNLPRKWFGDEPVVTNP